MYRQKGLVMKTLKMVKAESRSRQLAAREALEQEAQAYLESAKTWEKPDEVDEGPVMSILADVAAGHCRPIGIACDKCGFELAAEPGFPCMSSPPCRWVTCGVCGHRTTQSSEDR